MAKHPARPETPEPGAGENALAGILLMLLAMTIVPVMDAGAKYLSGHTHPLQLVWARYFFHLLILLPYMLVRFGRQTFRSARPGLQVLRGCMLAAATGLFFAAIGRMPLADAIATIFIYPFIITALSPVVLGEPVGPRRWLAVAVGFGGALIIIRPTGDVMNIGVLFALGAGAVYACYALSTRKLAGVDPPLVTLTFTGLVGAVISMAALPFVWTTPGLADWPVMFLMGLCAAVGHFCIISAYERATAATLAPLGYFEIVMATILGLVVFGEFPDALTWLGIAIVVASGIYISLRERRRRAPTAAPSEPRERL